ncbi:hypothetical protein [Methanimicrococcus hongohii]|uniref:hypothetical protein n=1 Tax=Methanimicrococcus hongohii TaxID=3028295 RepID=UPI00292D1F6E|nr:hypothetical protein [Methanimicrococcus sp. Hf6]
MEGGVCKKSLCDFQASPVCSWRAVFVCSGREAFMKKSRSDFFRHLFAAAARPREPLRFL